MNSNEYINATQSPINVKAIKSAMNAMLPSPIVSGSGNDRTNESLDLLSESPQVNQKMMENFIIEPDPMANQPTSQIQLQMIDKNFNQLNLVEPEFQNLQPPIIQTISPNSIVSTTGHQRQRQTPKGQFDQQQQNIQNQNLQSIDNLRDSGYAVLKTEYNPVNSRSSLNQCSVVKSTNPMQIKMTAMKDEYSYL